MAARPGRYDGKAIKGSGQWGVSGQNNTPQIGVDVTIKVAEGQYETGTVFLSFSAAAAPYSFQRLEALGWKGKGAADLHNLDGIDTNVVPISINEEVYDGKTRLKWEIATGGKAVMANPMDPKVFAQRVAALIGNATTPGVGGGGGTDAPPAGQGVKPPF